MISNTEAVGVNSPLEIIVKALTIISRGELTPTASVLDIIEEKSSDTPSIPENNN